MVMRKQLYFFLNFWRKNSCIFQNLHYKWEYFISLSCVKNSLSVKKYSIPIMLFQLQELFFKNFWRNWSLILIRIQLVTWEGTNMKSMVRRHIKVIHVHFFLHALQVYNFLHQIISVLFNIIVNCFCWEFANGMRIFRFATMLVIFPPNVTLFLINFRLIHIFVVMRKLLRILVMNIFYLSESSSTIRCLDMVSDIKLIIHKHFKTTMSKIGMIS